MFIETIEPADAPDDLAAIYGAVEQSWGFLPNWPRAFSLRPDAMGAWLGLNLTLKSGMDRRRYELATIAAARELRSTYCSIAHTWMLRDQVEAHDTDELAEIWRDAGNADALDDTDRAVMAYAAKVARDASTITQADVDELRRHGLSDQDVLNVALAASERCFFAKVIDAVGAQADGELARRMGSEIAELTTVGRPFADD